MFSQTQEYALRAVIWLAANRQGAPYGSDHIAKQTQVPASYLSKVLQLLAREGITASKRGVGGGFSLAHSPHALTVLQVINAVDPIQRIKSCPLSLKSHGTNLCPMHARLDNAIAHVERAFAESTIAELISQPGRPTPLVDGSPTTPTDSL